MGELLDREFQKQILTDVAGLYPQAADIQRSYGHQDDNRLLVNLHYLHEHGLVDFRFTEFLDRTLKMHTVKITAKGMDFITQDGGLSAILGVVTVKLHDETIRELLIKKVEEAPGDATVKSNLVEKIKALPADALGKITMDGLDKALSTAPKLLDLLSGLLG